MTFATYRLGDDIDFASGVVKAAARTPGKDYNPLYLSGPAGSGKTHLAHALANALLQEDPESTIFLTSGKKFNEALITAIESGDLKNFRVAHRDVKCLIIEDIEALVGKAKSQEEFFHTFNALHQVSKQIVITSREPASKIDLEERLRSRFQMGIVAELEPPSPSVLKDILNWTAELQKLQIDPESMDLFLASVSQLSHPEILSIFRKVLGYASLMEKDVSRDIVTHVLGTMNIQIPTPTEEPETEDLQSPIEALKAAKERIVALLAEEARDMIKKDLLAIRELYSKGEKALSGHDDDEVFLLCADISTACENARTKLEHRKNVLDWIIETDKHLETAKKLGAPKHLPGESERIAKEIHSAQEILEAGNIETAFDRADACIKIARTLPGKCLKITRDKIEESLSGAEEKDEAAYGKRYFNAARVLMKEAKAREQEEAFEKAMEILGQAYAEIKSGIKEAENQIHSMARNKKLDLLSERANVIQTASNSYQGSIPAQHLALFESLQSSMKQVHESIQREDLDAAHSSLDEAERLLETLQGLLAETSREQAPDLEAIFSDGEGSLLDALSAAFGPRQGIDFSARVTSGIDDDILERLKACRDGKGGQVLFLVGEESSRTGQLAHAMGNWIREQDKESPLVIMKVEELKHVEKTAKDHLMASELPMILRASRMLAILDVDTFSQEDFDTQMLVQLLIALVQGGHCIMLLTSSVPLTQATGLSEGMKESLANVETMEIH